MLQAARSGFLELRGKFKKMENGSRRTNGGYGLTICWMTFDGVKQLPGPYKVLERDTKEWCKLHGLKPQPL